MNQQLKLIAAAIFSFASIISANAQSGYVYNDQRPHHYETRELTREERDIQRDRDQLRSNYHIAEGLRNRIASDYDIRDRRAEHYDREQLEQVNRRIAQLQRDIERDEHKIRHEEHELREHQEGSRW